MLNPSTADQTQDDPTIRRVMHFADREGYDYLSVVNLYAARSTNPRHLALFDDPIGPGNDSRIRAETARADFVVAAWGSPPSNPRRRYPRQRRAHYPGRRTRRVPPW